MSQNKTNTVKMIIEFDLNEELLQEKGIDAQTIVQRLMLVQDNVIDGLNITRRTDIDPDNDDVTAEYYIENEKLISAILKEKE